ncbi:MAG: M14 family zinc carboxypeptidase [Desulfococcaceae bacterium]
MKISLMLCLMLMISPVCTVFSFDPASVKTAKITVPDREGLMRLINMGADVDSVRGNTVIVYASEQLLGEIAALGYEISIIPDFFPNVQDRAGTYHSYEELGDELDDIAENYPLICRIFSIGQSFQKRELWVMKITDSPDAEEDEPEITFISSMHGDEPVGMELCMNLIHLLAGNYGSDPELTDLVNETEIWIMPLMNPDGYAMKTRYNAQGFDLNRSFPDRVKDPFVSFEARPAETRHIMNWAMANSPVLSASFHTGALVVNYPFDSDPNPGALYSASPDDELFIEQSLTYSFLNKPMYDSTEFARGIVNGVEWYQVYGGMQDWHYLRLGCNQLTIELSDDKWPLYSEIPDLWEDNRSAMLAYMQWSLRGIRGIVTDSISGEPLKAAIRVEGIDHDVFTDPDAGDYHRMLVPGTYSIQVSATGYMERTVCGIEVGSGKAAREDIALIPKNAGDVNGYEETDLTDAILILQMLTGTNTETVKTAVDPDKDGKTGLPEAIFILRLCAF